MTTEPSPLRWWGWGREGHHCPLETHPDFWPALQKWLALPDELLTDETPPVPLDSITLRPTRLDDPVLTSLRRLLGKEAVRVDKAARVGHTYGKSYGDLVRLRAGYIPNPPDAVVYPADQSQVTSLVAWAAERDIVLIPYGGGSSVSGGLEPPPGEHPVITVDLRRLNRVLAVDHTSHTARVQAGITGPDLEAHLNTQGFTLGHFPQSFEFSTLGGWIATRSAGQHAIGYGGIEALIQAVRAVTPTGLLETWAPTLNTFGPNLLQLLIGSEGAYGIITEALVRLRPLPEARDYRGVFFEKWDEGIEAFRIIVQEPNLHPAFIHLFDNSAVTAYTLLNHEQRNLRRITDALVERFRPRRTGFSSDERALLVLGFEGSGGRISHQWRLAAKICEEHHGTSPIRHVDPLWTRLRYNLPYLRDILLGHSILVGTLGTTTTWTDLPRIYPTLVGATKGAIVASGGGPGYVLAHLAYACPQEVTIRAVFLGRQVDDPHPQAKQAQWETIRRAVAEALISAGGRITPDVGPWEEPAPETGRTTDPAIQLLRSLKESLDPLGTLKGSRCPIHRTDGGTSP